MMSPPSDVGSPHSTVTLSSVMPVTRSDDTLSGGSGRDGEVCIVTDGGGGGRGRGGRGEGGGVSAEQDG